MGATSAIEWTNATWNPWMGCEKVSSGCDNCYMFRDMARYGRNPHQIVKTSPATFNAPLKWKEPKLVFTCSWSDFFHKDADEWRPEAWQVIKATPHLTYQILTKRPARIKNHLPADWGEEGYENVWLGTTVENQKWAENRIPVLLEIPAKVRFLSCEPLLGSLQLMATSEFSKVDLMSGGIDWIITGGESGAKDKIRPASLDWFRSIRDQCHEADVKIAYFHKQHGGSSRINGVWGGRELDGREWNEMPEVR